MSREEALRNVLVAVLPRYNGRVFLSRTIDTEQPRQTPFAIYDSSGEASSKFEAEEITLEIGLYDGAANLSQLFHDAQALDSTFHQVFNRTIHGLAIYFSARDGIPSTELDHERRLARLLVEYRMMVMAPWIGG